MNTLQVGLDRLLADELGQGLRDAWRPVARPGIARRCGSPEIRRVTAPAPGAPALITCCTAASAPSLPAAASITRRAFSLGHAQAHQGGARRRRSRAAVAGAAAVADDGAPMNTGPSLSGLSFSSVTMRRASLGPTPDGAADGGLVLAGHGGWPAPRAAARPAPPSGRLGPHALDRLQQHEGACGRRGCGSRRAAVPASRRLALDVQHHLVAHARAGAAERARAASDDIADAHDVDQGLFLADLGDGAAQAADHAAPLRSWATAQVGVGDGHGQGVGGVGGGRCRPWAAGGAIMKRDLVLVGRPGADHGLLDQPARRIRPPAGRRGRGRSGRRRGRGRASGSTDGFVLTNTSSTAASCGRMLGDHRAPARRAARVSRSARGRPSRRRR